MKEVLEAKGWIMYYQCYSCGGRQYWSNKDKPGYEVRTKVRNNTFSILHKNLILGGPFWGYLVEEKLKQYVS